MINKGKNIPTCLESIVCQNFTIPFYKYFTLRAQYIGLRLINTAISQDKHKIQVCIQFQNILNVRKYLTLRTNENLLIRVARRIAHSNVDSHMDITIKAGPLGW